MPNRYQSRRVTLAVLTVSIVLLVASVALLIPGFSGQNKGLLLAGALLALAGLFAMRSTFRYSDRRRSNDDR
jgi:UPF0716 family protein affecting phage T7 exclusion